MPQKTESIWNSSRTTHIWILISKFNDIIYTLLIEVWVMSQPPGTGTEAPRCRAVTTPWLPSNPGAVLLTLGESSDITVLMDSKPLLHVVGDYYDQ